MSYMRMEIKLIQLLIPVPTHLQRAIKSNLRSSFQLKKSIFGISPFWCLDITDYSLSEIRKFYSTKIIWIDTFSAENINTFPVFFMKQSASFQGFFLNLAIFLRKIHFPNKVPFFKITSFVITVKEEKS